MIYIISTIQHSNKGVSFYKVYDTSSKSVMKLKPNQLTTLITSPEIQVVNATIVNNTIILKDWAHGLDKEERKITGGEFTGKHSGPKFVVLALENDSYKIVDYKGTLQNVSGPKLKSMASSRKLANCRIVNRAGNESIVAEDVYTIVKDKQFERLVEYKYNSFVAKAMILGYNKITFEYEIENREVTLIRYTGQSRDIILPTLITAIGANAFDQAEIKTIRMAEGLRVIGASALANCKLARVEIPSTVNLICIDAFMNNIMLLKNMTTFNMEKFKLLNSETILLHRYDL